MAYQSVDLTLVDQEILNSYSNMIEGLACYLGEGYEIVLHSLENYEHSVINIINGSHTGRKIGAPITDLALNMLEKIENTDKDYITYFSTNKKGEPLKSTTIAIRGEKRRIIGLLCMNLYMNTSLNDFVKTLDAGVVRSAGDGKLCGQFRRADRINAAQHPRAGNERCVHRAVE